ncbi:MAG TPA: protein-glutamate O-methyltransferase CheR [Acidimicrobiales bacterium]|nr:protein-glutamate O-methyltransferase CheR [Acidimicrobiales bacterium]
MSGSPSEASPPRRVDGAAAAGGAVGHRTAELVARQPSGAPAAPRAAAGIAGAAGAPHGPFDSELEDIELDLLLEAVFRRYGFDFRNYARASLRRRVSRRRDLERVPTISRLLERLLHDPECMERLLLDLSINVTAMFRDPGFYRTFREKVVPMLRTHPFVRIWNAGCSTGEETYSLAIMLAEEGLLERTRIYATDINQAVVARAHDGVFPLEKMREYTENYLAAGGTRAFSEYYVAAYDGARFDRALAANVVFAQHNLVADHSFNEFHVVVCRNVLIYFDVSLQARVHRLFYDSLSRFGILALGQKESVTLTPHEADYQLLDEGERLYRKRGSRSASASGTSARAERGR